MHRFFACIISLFITVASPYCAEVMAAHSITMSHPVGSASYAAGTSLTIDGNVYYTFGYDTAPARVRVRIFDKNGAYLLDVVAATYSASAGSGYYAQGTNVPDATNPTTKESQVYSAHSEDFNGAVLKATSNSITVVGSQYP